MNILLINANPVVSRLLILCTRDESVELNEVTTTHELHQDKYDIIFVDEASYGCDVSDFLSKLTLSKKIFISYSNDDMMGFDIVIKKPFLPSQIIDIIQNTLPIQDTADALPNNLEDTKISKPIPSNDLETEETSVIFPLEEEKTSTAVLDEGEIEKIKTLLNMEEDITNNENILSDDALEARKRELIKEQLRADGLEIVDEAEIVEELSISLDGRLEKSTNSKELKKTKTKKKKSKSKSKKMKFTEENMAHIEDAVEMAMASMTKKQMKKLLRGKAIEISVKLQEID